MISTSLARFVYNLVFYPVLSVGAHIAALFSRKLRRGLIGRYGVSARTRQFRTNNSSARIVLFHCASAGELEGVKPLAAECAKRGFLPCISYFSPSAETAFKPGDFAFADFSPFDSAQAARTYFMALKPDVVLITKHDVWPNFVWQAKELDIPIWLVNGNFHTASTKSWPGIRAFHRAVFSSLRGILAVSDEDANRAVQLVGNGPKVVSIGDSRFDRVWARSQAGNKPLAEFAGELVNRTILVAGSTHDRDDALLISSLAAIRRECPELQLLIVPHDPSDASVESIKRRAEGAGHTCAEITVAGSSSDVLIVNRSGILADVYQYGTFAYVGGGFDHGVHSILEPMAHGLKVICGPKIDVSREASVAMSEGLLAVVTDSAILARAFHSFHATREPDRVRLFVQSRTGVVNRIVDIVLGPHVVA